MKNIFCWIKEINSKKSPASSFTEAEWDLFNAFMIHKFMSQNTQYIEVVNMAQAIPTLEKVMIYNVYKEFIPRNNNWSKYIKSSVKRINTQLADHLRDHFQCSSREITEYLKLLDTTEINRILTNRGIDKKELKQLLK
jgi:IS1 family transposase